MKCRHNRTTITDATGAIATYAGDGALACPAGIAFPVGNSGHLAGAFLKAKPAVWDAPSVMLIIEQRCFPSRRQHGGSFALESANRPTGTSERLKPSNSRMAGVRRNEAVIHQSRGTRDNFVGHSLGQPEREARNHKIAPEAARESDRTHQCLAGPTQERPMEWQLPSERLLRHRNSLELQCYPSPNVKGRAPRRRSPAPRKFGRTKNMP